jgi:hypothetical protein
MLIRADVKCYYCGYVSGQVEGDPESTCPAWSYHCRPGSDNPPPTNPRQIRCSRCGGPVFLDDIETVRSHGRATHPTLAAVAG